MPEIKFTVPDGAYCGECECLEDISPHPVDSPDPVVDILMNCRRYSRFIHGRFIVPSRTVLPVEKCDECKRVACVEAVNTERAR